MLASTDEASGWLLSQFSPYQVTQVADFSNKVIFFVLFSLLTCLLGLFNDILIPRPVLCICWQKPGSLLSETSSATPVKRLFSAEATAALATSQFYFWKIFASVQSKCCLAGEEPVEMAIQCYCNPNPDFL